MLKAAPVILLAALASCAGAQISAQSAIIIDAGSGKVLWEKDADTPRFPASTTKIMTGLLLIEHCLPSDIITAPADIEKVKESSMHLKPFEQVTAENMLYAMMLRSANDGCYATAIHIAGSVPAFAQMMNERARQIGCTHTNFHNPNGLNDPLHTTSARDLALIAREAMKYETFRNVVRTKKKTISRSINWKDTNMVSRNKWLMKDPTADGIKTGYTIPAGHCYVGSATRNGFRVITAILKSANWQQDHKQLLDWAFAKFEKQQEVKAGEIVGKIPVSGGTSAEVEVAAKNDAYAVGLKGDTYVERVMETTQAPAPIKEGDTVGALIFRDKGGFEQRVPLVARESVSMSPITAVKQTAGTNGAAIAAGSLMFLGAYVVRTRRRTC
jgi:D-alanyl-D-alanine carboxypeptidase (penicillin-binding protein 5/6)